MKTSTLLIRPYAAEDNGALTEIWYRASTVAHGFLGDETLVAHRQRVSEIYLPQAETWVACLDGRPVGFLGLIDNVIGGLFVSPDAQGSGVGRALVAHGLALKGTLRLDVYALNHVAHSFYKRLGFVDVDRRPNDKEGLPFEEISMTLSS